MAEKPLDHLYVVRSPVGNYYADPEEHAAFAAANPATIEGLRQRAAKLWKMPPDDLIVERFDRSETLGDPA